MIQVIKEPEWSPAQFYYPTSGKNINFLVLRSNISLSDEPCSPTEEVSILVVSTQRKADLSSTILTIIILI